MTEVIDKHAVRLAFGRNAQRYDQVATLQHKMGAELLNFLPRSDFEPKVVVDLGCGTGVASRALQAHYPHAKVIAVDFALPMLQYARNINPTLAYLCADAECLPLHPASVSVFYSNAMLQWCNNIPTVFLDLKRLLTIPGLFLFSTFGPATLQELRQAWAEADTRALHVNTFSDCENLQKWLYEVGFVDVMTKRDYCIFNYADVKALMADLKGLGANNAIVGRSNGLLGKRRFAAMLQAYERLRSIDCTLPVTYEIIYGMAWRYQ